MQDFDKLIASAKPAVSARTRARVLEHARAHGAVALAPAPLRLSAPPAFLRAAALVMLALGAGVVSALLVPREQAQADITAAEAEIRAEVELLSSQVTALERLHELEARVDRLTAAPATGESLTALVEDAARRYLDRRDAERAIEWRERHIAHVRRYHTEQRDATVSRLRTELKLTAEQEAQIVALLDDAGRQAEALIGDYYGQYGRKGRRHGGHHMHEKFEALANATETRLALLLDEQQRERFDHAVVSAEPADWAPSGEFRDDVDHDVWMNWLNVSRE